MASIMSAEMRRVLNELLTRTPHLRVSMDSFDQQQIQYLIANAVKAADESEETKAWRREVARTKKQPIQRPNCKHTGLCRFHALRGLVRVFCGSFALKGGISAITFLLFRRWGRLRKSLSFSSKLLRVLVRMAKAVFCLDNVRFAGFLGLLVGVFKAVQCVMRKLRKREDALNAVIAGALASSALMVESPSRRSTWALYLLARAGDLLLRMATHAGYVPNIPYGATVAFSLLATHIMYAWHLDPSCLSRSYHSWISSKGGLDTRIVGGVRNIVQGRPCHMESWCRDNNIPQYTEKFPRMLPCSVFHPLEPRSCTLHAVKRWGLGFVAAAPVYLAVHGLPLLLFRTRLLFNSPLHTVWTFCKSVFYSSSFVTTFQTVFWWVFCTTRHLIGRDSRISTAMAGLCAGSSVLWEKATRRPEFVLFCLPRNLDCAWKQLKRRNLVSDVPYSSVGLLAMAMSVIFACYQHRPEIFKPSYLNILHTMLGAN